MIVQVVEKGLPFHWIDRNVYGSEMIGIAVYVESSVDDALGKTEFGGECID